MTTEQRPIRVQRKRTKGFRLPPNTVSVTRPGKWGNPFRVGQPGINTPEDAVARYREVMNRPDMELIRLEVVRELRGKNLACYCPLDKPCHADVLLELANRPE